MGLRREHHPASRRLWPIVVREDRSRRGIVHRIRRLWSPWARYEVQLCASGLMRCAFDGESVRTPSGISVRYDYFEAALLAETREARDLGYTMDDCHRHLENLLHLPDWDCP